MMFGAQINPWMSLVFRAHISLPGDWKFVPVKGDESGWAPLGREESSGILDFNTKTAFEA